VSRGALRPARRAFDLASCVLGGETSRLRRRADTRCRLRVLCCTHRTLLVRAGANSPRYSPVMAPERRHPIIEHADLDRLLDGVAAGLYHLVMGAGGSAGVSNSHGPLPMAAELTALLLEEADATAPPAGVTLQRAFTRAVATRGAHAVEALLRMRYSRCTPAEWQLICPKIPWQAIWTLNVDDSMEHAYLATGDRAQRAVVKLWQDAPTPLGGRRDEVPIVHLHGYVGELEKRDEPQLVFTLEQYLGVLRTTDLGNWQTRFRGEYPSAPVIVIGARLHEEVDLAGVIQTGNNSADFGYPSLIVRPNLTDFERDEYREWGLLPVSASAEDFLELLRSALKDREEAAKGDAYSTRYTRSTFFELTGRKAAYSRPAGHDFYGGHEPQWLDILENRDAVPKWVKDLSSEIGPPQDYANVPRLYYLHGDPFSGKSVGLLRLARELARLGWRPAYLTGQERLDVEEALRYFADRPNGLLIVDDLRPELSEIANLLSRADQSGQRMVVVGAERRSSLYHTRRVVSAKYLVGVESRLFVEPTSGFWTAILLKRHRAGRLGILESEDRQAWRLHFVRHQFELFSSLASLEDAEGFIDRGLRVIGSIEPSLRVAFAGVGLFAAVGLEAPVSAVAASSGMSVSGFLTACEPNGVLSEWIALDERAPGFVRMRHRYLGELLLRSESRQEHGVDLPSLLQDLLISISDRVGFESIMRKDFYHRAASQLMDLALVRRVLRVDDVDNWYEQLSSQYGWNARFWEQRALGLPDQLDRAFSYAKRAVSRHEDAFTLNTLGTVLMRRAAHPSTSDASRRRYWSEGNAALVASREDGRGRYELPFLTFFGQTQRVRDAVGTLPTSWEAEVREAVRSWLREAVKGEVTIDHDLRSMIAALPPEWIEDVIQLSPRKRSAPQKRARRAKKRS
jgi:hypothetical protein